MRLGHPARANQTVTTHKPDPARAIRRDLLTLGAVCAVVYFIGLATHGLTNWQESVRCLAASEMHQRGDWIVPTIGHEPYLAKPPLIYWCQLALAGVTGSAPDVVHLRLTVALGATLGVLLMYLLVRSLLVGPRESAGEHEGDARHQFARRGALWSALFLATGLLYVRSGRIGELDILLVPTVILGIHGVWIAWRARLEGARRTHLPGVALACLGAALVALAKGPSGLLVLMLAAYGGIALHTLANAEPMRTPTRRIAIGTAALAGLAAAGAAMPEALRAGGIERWIGVVLFAGLGAILAWGIVALARPRVALELFRVYAKTHPVGVPLVAVGAVWLWGRAVASRIGDEAVANAVRTEAGENLVFFHPDSPIRYLEAASYGVGLGSIGAIAAIVWLLRDRPKIAPGVWVILAWSGLGVAAFALVTKGVPRYLTPVWPGLAALAGVWFAHWLNTIPSRNATIARRAAAVGVGALAIGQGLWYGFAREALQRDRSPRDLVRELLRPELGVDVDRLGGFDIWSPAMDFYAGQRIERWDGPDPDGDVPPYGVGPPVDDLLAELQRTGETYTLIVRADPYPRSPTARPGAAVLEDAGFVVEPIELDSAWRIDNRRTRVEAVRVRAPAD